MTLNQLLRALRRRWRIVTAAVVAATVGVLLITLLSPPEYQATTRIFVSTQVNGGNADQLYQGGSFSAERVKSYAELLSSPAVLQPVADATGGEDTVASLGSKLAVDVPTGTVVLNVSISDANPERAASLVNGVADQLRTVIESLEAPGNGQPSPVRAVVVASASPPVDAVWPNPLVNLALGLLVGLALGILSVVIREASDKTIKNVEQLRASVNIPVLGSVEQSSDPRQSLTIQSDPRGRSAEAFRYIRTNVQFANVDDDARSIVVTSSVQGEGKSVIASNLAIAQAELGFRVCLVDADLRRPSVSDKFGLVRDAGLTTALVGKTSVSDVQQPVSSHLSVICSGQIPPNPSELLASRRMQQVLSELESSFDFVIIDSPPVLPVADALVLAGISQATIFVCAADSTSRVLAASAIDSLAGNGCKLLGSVLNKASPKATVLAEYGYKAEYAYEPPERRRSAVETDTIRSPYRPSPTRRT